MDVLDEVEISGFKGDDHELDFLKLILKCAPMLKTMTVELSREVSSCNDECTEIYNIFRAYSSVECYVYLSSGEYLFCRLDQRGLRCIYLLVLVIFVQT